MIWKYRTRRHGSRLFFTFRRDGFQSKLTHRVFHGRYWLLAIFLVNVVRPTRSVLNNLGHAGAEGRWSAENRGSFSFSYLISYLTVGSSSNLINKHTRSIELQTDRRWMRASCLYSIPLQQRHVRLWHTVRISCQALHQGRFCLVSCAPYAQRLRYL